MKNHKLNKMDGAHNLDIRLYTRRWLLLALFMWFCCSVGSVWMQFTSINNVVARYYNVPGSQVEWTAIMCMAARAFVLFPSLFLIDKLDTRNTLILGSTLSLIGAIVKAFSVAPDRFNVVLLGHVFSALSVVFTYSLIGRFSAAWFSSDEISTAGALGCVGDQLGGAVSFLFPALFVPDSPNTEEVERGMRHMHYFYAGNALITLILILIFFRSNPRHPPSAAQVHNRSKKTERVYECAKQCLANPSFLLFTCSHAVLLGSAMNGYGTLLNEMIVTNYPGFTVHTGTIGSVNYLSGIIGSVVVSYILDKTRKFKSNAIVLAAINCICLAFCAVAMKAGNILDLYVAYMSLGFFLQAYYATGIQMGIELTFPIPEGITVATMSVCIELCSMVSATVFGIFVRKYGDLQATMCMVLIIFLSTVTVCFVPARFKREELEKAAKSAELKEFLPSEEKKIVISA